MDLEIIKRSADSMLALAAIVSDDKKSKAFMKELQANIEEYKQTTLNGYEVKRLTKWDHELSDQAAQLATEREHVNNLVPRAKSEANEIREQARKVISAAERKHDEAQALKVAAEQKYGEEAAGLRAENTRLNEEAKAAFHNAQELEKEALRHRNDAKMAVETAQAQEEKWKQKMAAISQAMKAGA